jgi:hypothetical protein
LLLAGLSVYQAPADSNAVLFQVGTHDWAAASEAGARGPTPPYQSPGDLDELIATCRDAGLVVIAASGQHGAHDPGQALAAGATITVPAAVSAELHRLLAQAGREDEIAQAHLRAARYWQWRAAAWPQDRQDDIRDLLQARQHLISGGDTAAASELARVICAQLSAWGEHGRAAEVIQATLDALPERSGDHASWLHELAATAQARGDHAMADRLFCRAVAMFTELGDARGAARGYACLGVLAHARGDYRAAERHYAAERRYKEAASRPSGRGRTLAAGRPSPPPPPAEVLAAPVQALAAPPDVPPEFRQPELGRPVPTRPGLARTGLVLTAAAAVAAVAMTALAGAREPGRAGGAADAGGAASGGHALASIAAQRDLAAAWVASRVAGSAVVGCDRAMCAALHAHGIAAGDLLVIGPGGQSDPLGSNVVVGTAALRSEFGSRLAGVYAPLAIARFGTGGARIEIRVTAPDGSAAYLGALQADQRARAVAGGELIANARLTMTPAARRDLLGGRVDSRVLLTIAAMAHLGRVSVLSFGGVGPGADPAAPLPAAEMVSPGGAGSGRAGQLRPLLSFLRAQRPPYLAAADSLGRLPGGQPVLRFTFGEPSPLGLLSQPLSPIPGAPHRP